MTIKEREAFEALYQVARLVCAVGPAQPLEYASQAQAQAGVALAKAEALEVSNERE